jgi:hypothetical protein
MGLGVVEDVPQALHDAPQIQNKIRLLDWRS